jgi:uroporphyrinogen decarboxylase
LPWTALPSGSCGRRDATCPSTAPLRQEHTLLTLCRTPELAVEATLQPVRRLGVDAAILFSDLLLPLEPMGIPFEFQAGEGP